MRLRVLCALVTRLHTHVTCIALACARIYSHASSEGLGRRTRVAFELLASGHAWTDKLLVSGTVAKCSSQSADSAVSSCTSR